MTQTQPISRDGDPYPQDGISVDARGVRHYDDFPSFLPDMLSGWTERPPDAGAVVELGGRAAQILPPLRERGVDEQQIDQMLIDNPRRYFTGAKA